MNRRRFLETAGVTAAGTTLFAGCVGEDADNGAVNGDVNDDDDDDDAEELDEVELTFAHRIGEDDEVNQDLVIPFWETLGERSGGRLTIDAHWGGALGGTIEQHDMLRDGTIDYTSTIQHYFDIWEQHNAPNVPGIVDSLTRSGEGIDNLDYLIAHNIECMPNGFLYDDFQRYDIHIGPNFTNPTMRLFTNEEVGEVTQPEDWEGLRLSNTTEMQAHMISELGATVDDVDYTEWYQAFDRGVVDGGVDPGIVVDLFDAHEVAPNIATNYQLDRYHNPQAINLETYRSMSEELQTVWDETSWEQSIENLYWRLEYVDRMFTRFEEEGANLYEIPESTVEWQIETVEPVAEEFLQDIGAWESYLRFVELAEHIAEERGDFEPETVDEQVNLAPDDHPVAEWWADYEPQFL